MGSHMDNAETPQDEKYDISTTRTASGKEGQFFNQICRLNWVHNLGVSLALTLSLAAGFPCRTYAMVDCNINQEWAYITKNGEPVPEAKCGLEANKYRNLAIAHDTMLSDFVESNLNWVLAAGANGEQRWFYIENGLASYTSGSDQRRRCSCVSLALVCRQSTIVRTKCFVTMWTKNTLRGSQQSKVKSFGGLRFRQLLRCLTPKQTLG